MRFRLNFSFVKSFRLCVVNIFFLAILLSFASCKTVPKKIVSKPKLNSAQLTAFFMYMSPNSDVEKVKLISALYVEEGKMESINSDIAFAQMCLETGYLSFKGLIKSDMNNFCGLGAIDAEHNGIIFENEAIGIRAHIQHLKAYASKKPLINSCVDPRYKYVVPKGKAPKLKQLTGKWATDPEYSKKLENILYSMYQFAF